MNLCYSDLKFDEKCVLPDTVDYLKNLICAQEGHLLTGAVGWEHVEKNGHGCSWVGTHRNSVPIPFCTSNVT